MSQKNWYEDDLQKVLFDEATISNRVRELAADITEDYENEIRNGEELIIVGLLKGSFMFLSEIAKRINLPVKVDMVTVKSYQGINSKGNVKLMKDLDLDPTGAHILVCEDMIDTGRTLVWLQRHLKTKNTKSVKLCILVRKLTHRRKVDIKIDYCGFECPDLFLVGYGMDFDERYRTMPCIGVLHPKMYKHEDEDEEKKLSI